MILISNIPNFDRIISLTVLKCLKAQMDKLLEMVKFSLEILSF